MRGRRCNCFIWAFVVWRRLCREGHEAYWCARVSRHIWGLHWLVWHPRYQVFLQFKPTPAMFVGGSWRMMYRKMWYAGYIARGDADDHTGKG